MYGTFTSIAGSKWIGYQWMSRFKVDWIPMDGQFKTLLGDSTSLGLHLNDVAEDEHVGEA